MRGTAGK
jgi:hypothetical protein